jgi:hypothetical protein
LETFKKACGGNTHMVKIGQKYLALYWKAFAIFGLLAAKCMVQQHRERFVFLP